MPNHKADTPQNSWIRKTASCHRVVGYTCRTAGHVKSRSGTGSITTIATILITVILFSYLLFLMRWVSSE